MRMVCQMMLAVLLAAFAGAGSARADTVEADLATHHVAVKTDFAGVKVLLFGAVLDGNVKRLDGPRDIIIDLRGPKTRMLVRQKKQVAGIWVNGETVAFEDVPGYYAIISNRPASEIASSYVLREHGIGLNTLKANMLLSSGGFNVENSKEYADAIVRVRGSEELYQRIVGGVAITGRHLFRAEFELPANVPLGDYTADVFVFRAGEFVTKYSTSLRIEKRGVEKFIYELAHEQPFIYGVLAVLTAVMAGMGAAAIFRKR